MSESDAAFEADIALKSLDDLIRANPPRLVCWRDRFLQATSDRANVMRRHIKPAQ